MVDTSIYIQLSNSSKNFSAYSKQLLCSGDIKMSPTQILPSRRLPLSRTYDIRYHFGVWDWALPYLEANTLVCCYSVDAIEYVWSLSQRQRVSFFIAQQVASCLYWSLLSPNALGVTDCSKVYGAHREGFCCSWGTLSKHALCPGGDGFLLLPFPGTDTSWEMAPVKSNQDLESSVYPARCVKNTNSHKTENPKWWGSII